MPTKTFVGTSHNICGSILMGCEASVMRRKRPVLEGASRWAWQRKTASAPGGELLPVASPCLQPRPDSRVRAEGGLEEADRVLKVPVEEIVDPGENSELLVEVEAGGQIDDGVPRCGQPRY